MAHEVMFTEETDSLEGIELTPEGEKPQKEIEFVTDENRSEVLDDPVRLEIIKILRRGIQDTQTSQEFNEEKNETIIRKKEVRRNIMSVTEIVKASEENDQLEKVTKNQAYYHIPKLIESGFVIKYGTVQTGDRTTDYYRRTARSFVLTAGKMVSAEEEVRKRSEKHVERYSRVFDLGLSEDEKDKLVNHLVKAERIINKARPKIAKMITGDVADSEVIDMYMWLLRIHAFGSEEWVNIQREMHHLLFGSNSNSKPE